MTTATATATATPATAAYIAVRECLGDWILEEYNSITAEYIEMPEYYPSWKECKRAIVGQIGDHLCYNDHPIFEVWESLDWSDQYGILDDVLDFMLNVHAECADW